MSTRSQAGLDANRLRAEPELRAKLDVLCADGRSEHAQEWADALLARIAWSRLVEPGDGVAGAIVSALGAETALRMLIEGSPPQEVVSVVRSAGFELTQEAVGDALLRWRLRLDRSATVADIEHALAAGLRVIGPGDALWPAMLDDLGVHAPLMLWVRGNPELLRMRALSVVGARAATGYGTHLTAEIVDGLCQAGLTIVSGAAYGVDAVAHRTALACGAATVAVLAGGADRAYPLAHRPLLERIGAEGAVCAEMVPGTAPTKWRFRMRNRLIAALSPATLVTEAGMRSGTLNTAGHAAQLGRALGAVPGPVTSAASAGCHALIRDYGATLITNAREACELAGSSARVDALEPAGEAADATPRLPSVHERVLDAIPLRGGRSADEIARRAGLGVAEARGALAELELLQRVRCDDSPGLVTARWLLARRE